MRNTYAFWNENAYFLTRFRLPSTPKLSRSIKNVDSSEGIWKRFQNCSVLKNAPFLACSRLSVSGGLKKRAGDKWGLDPGFRLSPARFFDRPHRPREPGTGYSVSSVDRWKRWILKTVTKRASHAVISVSVYGRLDGPKIMRFPMKTSVDS